MSLVSTYNFNNTPEDSWGNNDATLNGATYSGDPHLGSNSLAVDGVNDYASITNVSALRPSNLTITAWVKQLSGGVGAFRMIYGIDSYAVGCGYILVLSSSDNKIYFYIRDGGAWKFAKADAALTAGYHHIVGRYLGTEVSLWIDNVKQAVTATASTVSYPNSNDVTIGKYGPDYMRMYIDAVKFYNHGLSTSEISDDHNGGIGIEISAITSNNRKQKLMRLLNA